LWYRIKIFSKKLFWHPLFDKVTSNEQHVILTQPSHLYLHHALASNILSERHSNFQKSSSLNRESKIGVTTCCVIIRKLLGKSEHFKLLGKGKITYRVPERPLAYGWWLYIHCIYIYTHTYIQGVSRL